MMAMATYLDNILVLAGDASGADSVLAWAREFLRSTWRLEVTDESCEVLVPTGAAVLPTRYKRV